MSEGRGPVGGDGGDKELKVTDKRMFTADGRLRDEYRHLEERGSAVAEPPADRTGPAADEAAPRAADSAPQAAPTAAPAAETPAAAAPGPDRAPAGADPGAPPLEIPGTPEGLGAPSFLDLVTVLAEPIALYLGDVQLPDGKSAENLEMARLHIDLLDVLRRKTAGNLTVEESSLLEDLLYRCRLRYVQKRG